MNNHSEKPSIDDLADILREFSTDDITTAFEELGYQVVGKNTPEGEWTEFTVYVEINQELEDMQELAFARSCC